MDDRMKCPDHSYGIKMKNKIKQVKNITEDYVSKKKYLDTKRMDWLEEKMLDETFSIEYEFGSFDSIRDLIDEMMSSDCSDNLSI